jgi:hypothetical protein
MHTFVLIKIDQVKGKFSFHKLSIDGNCEFDEFCEALERTNEKKALNTIYAIMESVANLRFLPKKKYREL